MILISKTHKFVILLLLSLKLRDHFISRINMKGKKKRTEKKGTGKFIPKYKINPLPQYKVEVYTLTGN